MLTTKEKGILLVIITYCQRIEEKICGISEVQFMGDMDLKEIACFNLFQIGEMAKGLSQDFIAEYSGVQWNSIKGMRDRIGHGYRAINFEMVWETVTNDVRPLLDYCKSIVNQESN